MQQVAKGPPSSSLRAYAGSSAVGRPSIGAPEGRFVSEEDLQKERERWMQMCMHEVWKLENSAFERIQRHMDDAIATLKNNLTTQMEELVRAETSTHGLELADLRRQLQHFEGSVPANNESQRVARLEVEIKAIRSEFSAVIVATGEMTNAVKNEFQEQRRSAGGDQLRAVQETAAKEGIARGALKSELKQEMQMLRTDLEERIRAIADMLGVTRSSLDAKVREIGSRVDDLDLKVNNERQDTLHQTIQSAVRGGGDQLSKLDSIHVEMKQEQGRRAAESAALKARVEALESSAVQRIAQGPASNEMTTEIERLSSRIIAAEELIKSFGFAAGLGNIQADNSDSKRTMDQLQAQVTALAVELQEERKDRCKAFSDFGRLTDEVARAATTSIEHAHRRFAEELELAKNRPQDQANVLGGKLWTPVSQGASNQGSAATSRHDTGFEGDDARSSLAPTNFARLVGEMDAELRMEFASRIKLVTAELRGELLSEIAARSSAVEAKLSVVAATCGAQIQQVRASLDVRINMLEAERLGKRVANLEMSAQSTSISLGDGSANIQALGKSIAQELAASGGMSTLKVPPFVSALGETVSSDAGSSVSSPDKGRPSFTAAESQAGPTLCGESGEGREVVSLKTSLTSLIKTIQRSATTSVRPGVKGVSDSQDSQSPTFRFRATSPDGVSGALFLPGAQFATTGEEGHHRRISLPSSSVGSSSPIFRHQAGTRPLGLNALARSPGAAGVPISAQLPGANLFRTRSPGSSVSVARRPPSAVAGIVSR